jgi:hypothetical protein
MSREGYDGNEGHSFGDFDSGDRCGCDEFDSFGYGLLIVLWL